MMEWEKQLHQLADRLSYLKDIFPGKHEEDIALLQTRLDEIRQKLETCNIPKAFQGVPVTLVAASIVSMTFVGFGGIVEGMFG